MMLPNAIRIAPRRITKHLHVLRTEVGELEELCLHCAACCYAKVPTDRGAVLVKRLRCKHLRVDGEGVSRCAVYDDRFRVAPWCRDLEDGIAKGVFPQSCPYVATLSDYSGPAVPEGAEERQIEKRLRQKYAGRPCPEWADPAAWKAFLEGVAR